MAYPNSAARYFDEVIYINRFSDEGAHIVSSSGDIAI
jgi:hypothetical protein